MFLNMLGAEVSIAIFPDLDVYDLGKLWLTGWMIDWPLTWSCLEPFQAPHSREKPWKLWKTPFVPLRALSGTDLPMYQIIWYECISRECHEVPSLPCNEAFETSKKDPFCRTYRHGHMALTRTVANGCGRLRTVADGGGRLRTVADGCERKRNVERTHPQPPDPQSETGTLATHSGKKCISFNKKTGDEPRDWGVFIPFSGTPY